jgi:D-aminopeptidase
VSNGIAGVAPPGLCIVADAYPTLIYGSPKVMGPATTRGGAIYNDPRHRTAAGMRRNVAVFLETSTMQPGLHASLAALLVTLAATQLGAQERAGQSQDRPRARELGIAPGVYEPGQHNAITDVAGVTVGHVTLVSGERVRTGVTAVLPHGGNLFQQKVTGAVFVGNAFGKLAGSTQVRELGTIESPIVLVNTLAVGPAVTGVVSWTLAQPGNEQVRSVNALVGETNDASLNDIRGAHLAPNHVVEAIRAAKAGPVPEGAVGAGTGTIAFGWKGGIGTSSRRVPVGQDTWTVGVLVQSNYGGRLTIAGVPVWREIDEGSRSGGADGSCMIVVATDAPLDARNLERLAARGIFAMARTGSTYSNGSGDYAIAFSTHASLRVTGSEGPQARTVLPTDGTSALFEAVLDATEEALYNSMLRATDTAGNGRTVRALPIDELKRVLAKYRR